MKKIYLFIIGIILCTGVQSQISQINHSSMYGGGINGFAKNASCILVATDGGIFKTTNEGLTWTNATQNFDPYSTSCRKIISIGNVFYAMPDNSYQTSIYKSSDNGANWTALTFSNFWPNDMAMFSDSIYVMAGDNTGGHLYSSKDGINWNMRAKLWDGNWQGGNSNLFSSNSDKLFIVFNDTLFYTKDGSRIDTVSYNGLSKPGFSDNSDNIEGDALGNIFYREDAGILKYDFNAKTWKNITAGKVPAGFQIVDFSVTDHTVFVNAMSPTIGMILYRSTDQGNSFTELTNTGLILPMIGNIIEVSANGFIGNALDDRIVVSSDGGNTWTSTDNQFIATSASNLVKSGNTVLFSRETKGITLSNDKGINWSSVNNGIPGFGGIAYFVREITVVKDTLFAFCYTDPFAEISKLYKSADNGKTWVPCFIPSPWDQNDDFWFAGKADSALYIYCAKKSTNEYTAIVSFDFGKTWSEPQQQDKTNYVYIKGTKQCSFIFPAPNDQYNNFTDVSRLNDFSTITTIDNGLFNNSLVIKRIKGAHGDKGEAMMDFDAANNKALFVAVDRNFMEVEKLYLFNMTTNGWSEIFTTGLPSGYKANCIKYVGNNIWLLATNTGLYKSTDAGSTWVITHNISEFQRGIVVNSIQVVGNKVFLGTLDNGIWTSELTFDFSVGFTASNTLLTTVPFTVKITNGTPNKSKFKFTWNFGDGSTATTTTESYVMHTFAFNGDYTITLTAEEKSSGFTSSHTEVDYITCAGGTQDTCFIPVISQGTTGTICGNDSIKLSTQKRKGYTYQWTWNNNILSVIDTVIYAKLAGDYKVKAINGIYNRVSTPYTLMTYSVQKPIIYSSGIINTCSKDSMKLSVAPAFTKYSWSTGKTTAFIYIKKSQEYIVTVTDNNNCKIASDPYNANYSIINIPYICMVSVDSSNKNKIIWDKPVTKEIRSYNIYKESTIAGKYNLIGNVAYDKMSTYTDNNSVPSSHSDRYKLSAIDTCGNETALSTHHRTLHLSVSKNAMGSGYQLIWLDSYEGFNFYMYYIFRGTTKKNMVLIDSIQNTLYSYTDPTNLTGQLLYVVAAVKPGTPCNPTGSKGVFPVDFKGATYSVSNVDGFELHESIQDVEQMSMNIYPNPTNDKITIEMDNQNKTYNLEILNMIGQRILNKNVNNTIEQVDLSSCSTGIYFVKIKISDKTIVKKIIKN